MEVILKEDVSKLGSRGEVVKVAEGYGRNYLIPKKLAIEATAANRLPGLYRLGSDSRRRRSTGEARCERPSVAGGAIGG